MRLAYLLAKTVNDESWTGGLLITDHHGLPLDFRYIEPIHPSKIQKLIYGGALRRYLLLDAIAGTLLKAANLDVDWLFISDPMLLELDGKAKGRCVIIESRDEEPLAAVGEWKKDDIGKIALQMVPTGPPAQLTFQSRDENDTEKIAEELASLAQDLDFTEPLNRVGEALKEICQNGTD